MKDWWGRHGWDGTSGVASVIMMLEPGTGKVKGTRWATGGNLLAGNFQLKHLYPKAEGVEVAVNVKGDALTWLAEGEQPRNFSEWRTLGQQGELVFTDRDGHTLTKEELTELEVGDIRLRASLTVMGVGQLWVSGHVLGDVVEAGEKLELADIVKGWELRDGVRSPNIPTVGVRVDGNKTGQLLDWILTEPEGAGLGWGCLPVLEEISTEEAPVDRDEVEGQLCAFLRQAALPHNMKQGWAKAMLARTPPARKDVTVQWPAYPGPTTTETGTTSGLVRPRPVIVSKYSTEAGAYSERVLSSLDVPVELRAALAGSMNASLAKGTWSRYLAAYQRFLDVLDEYEIPEPSVISTRHLLIFTGAMLLKGLKAGTIQSYISGIRKVGEAKGAKFTEEDLALVRAAIRGSGNLEARKPYRQLMTVEMVSHIKKGLAAEKGTFWSRHNKRVFWLLVCWLFWSSCRGGELAMELEAEFDPRNNLQWRDVKAGEDVVSLTLRSPKEVRGLQTVEVELFEVMGDLCPVQAFRKFRERNKVGEEEDLPVFRWDSGKNITLKRFNKLLKGLLMDRYEYEGALGVHCFRNSIPSLMKQLGYSEEEIKAQGRWTSEAFLKYIKLSRERRLGERRRLAGDIQRILAEARRRQ